MRLVKTIAKQCRLGTRRNTIVRFLACSFAVCSFTIGSGVCAGDDADLKRVLNAWKSRQKYTEHVELRWEAEVLYTARSHNGDEPDGRVVAFPERDTEVLQKNIFMISGMNRFRLETTGKRTVAQIAKIADRFYLVTTDGRVSKSFFGKGKQSGRSFPPVGFIRSSSQFSEFRVAEYLPILGFFRPLHPQLNQVFDFQNYVLLGNVNLAGINCNVYEKKEDRVKFKLWLSSDELAIPVRYVESGRPSTTDKFKDTVDITWHYDSEKVDLFPVGWKLLFGTVPADRLYVQYSVNNVVTKVHDDVPKAAFQFEFPVNTIVSEETTDAYYLVKENGRKRMIQFEEETVPYERLIETDSGQALVPDPRTNRGWPRYLIVFGVFVVCGVLLVVYKVRNQH